MAKFGDGDRVVIVAMPPWHGSQQVMHKDGERSLSIGKEVQVTQARYFLCIDERFPGRGHTSCVVSGYWIVDEQWLELAGAACLCELCQIRRRDG